MAILDLSRPHTTWNRVVDRETLWIVTLSAPILGSWIFAVVLIALDNAFP